MRLISPFLSLVLPVVLFCPDLFAYAEFIGYGYSNCLACHYDGQGGGALTDEGRALFATEITARDQFPEEMKEEDIAARSGFLGRQAMPWWIRPGIKYRGLWLQNNPGSPTKSEKFYPMQNDINLNVFFDKKQTYAVITTASYTLSPRNFSSSPEEKTPYWFAKEYYLRWQTGVKNLWVYAGQMDKVFGIRHPDHTAVNRATLGFGPFDQSLGVRMDYTPSLWSLTGQVFFSNADEKTEARQKGLSLSGDYEVYEKFRVGGSVLHSKSQLAEGTRLAAFSRLGLSKGSALLAEAGLMRNQGLLPGAEGAKNGFYAFVESWILLRRGYNLLSTLEYSKTDLSAPALEKMRWSVGGVLFPVSRTEVRTVLINTKNTVPQTGVPDNWQVQMQLHLSL